MGRQDSSAKDTPSPRVVVGFYGLILVLALVWLAPGFLARILFTFSTIAFVWAAVGFYRPAWARIPNRLAGVWILTMSFGLFLGGGVLLSPPNGSPNEGSVVSDAQMSAAADSARRRVQEREALERHRAATSTAADPEPPAPDPTERRERAAQERRSTLLERLMDADGMGMCNIRLQNAARAVYGAGGMYRGRIPDFPEQCSV